MDEIRRKLELIDKQLTGRDLHDHIISTCPLVFAAAGLIAGILAQSLFDCPVVIWVVVLGLCTAGAVAFFLWHPSSTTNCHVTAYLALGCFACLGAVRLADYRRAEPDDIRNYVADERKLATIGGLIVTDPYVSRNADWKFARFKPTEPTTSFYVMIREVKAVHGWAPTTGTVRMQVAEPAPDVKAADTIRAYCWLDRFEPPTNPGQFDTAAFLARRNIFVSAFVNSRDGIEVLQRPRAGRLAKMRAQLRKLATEALVGDVSEQDSSRGLLEALLLGERREIDSQTYQAFRKTGLLHFVSLSGMHLGILVGIIWWLCKTAGFLKPARAVVCALAVGIFLLIVPPRAPTIRAAIIVWVFCASILARRHANPANTLSLAAIILLLVRPTQLFEAGWQLSFASVLGIILFADRIGNVLEGKVTDRLSLVGPGQRKRLWHRTLDTLALYSNRLFAVGFAAWLGSAGVLLYHFYNITPLASVWTVLVFPFVGIILILGFLKMLLFFLLPALSAILGTVAAFFSDLLIGLVKLIAYLDISQILVGHVPLAAILFYYCMIVLIGFASFRRPLIKTVICASMLLVIVIYLGALKWQRTHRDELIMTCLDVGHGQAILVQLPPKTNVLFDAGSLYRSNVGTRIVTPFLDYAGIGKIDAVIISHNDTDHINGIPEIALHGRVGKVYANQAFFDETDTWGTAQFLTDCLSEQGLGIERLPDNLDLHSSAKVKLLWPNETIDSSETLSENDRSLVSLVEFAGVNILLCSDIEVFAQRELLRLYPDLKADIVVIPHHGSTKTAASGFLTRLNASILISSCDQSQYERTIKDSPSTASDPPRYLYTAINGAVRVRVRADGTTQVNTLER